MRIKEKVFKILSALSGHKEIDETQHLIQKLGMDSLQLVTLLVELEDTFNITLDEVDMNPFDLQTVSDVIELVKKYKKSQRGKK